MAVTIVGLTAVQALLHQLGLAVKDETPLTQAAAVLLNRTRTRFLAQQEPDGTRWPVSQAAMDRAADGSGGGTLFDTGTLFHSLTIRQPAPLSRAIFTDVSYAAYHQYGTGVLPQRQFLGFSKDDIDMIQNFVHLRLKAVK